MGWGKYLQIVRNRARWEKIDPPLAHITPTACLIVELNSPSNAQCECITVKTKGVFLKVEYMGQVRPCFP